MWLCYRIFRNAALNAVNEINFQEVPYIPIEVGRPSLLFK